MGTTNFDELDIGGAIKVNGTTVIDSSGKIIESAGIEIADGDAFSDTNGNEVLEFAVVGSAVNNLLISNSATGANPILAANGEANTGITLTNSEAEEIVIFDSVATSVNELTIASAATGVGPSISATGDDTNIDLEIAPKGNGAVIVTTAAQSGVSIEVADDGAAGGGLSFYHESASPATDDDVGTVLFTGNNDAASITEYAVISGTLVDPAAGSEVGAVDFSCQGGSGSLIDVASFGGDGIFLDVPVYLEQTEQALSGAGAVDITSQTTNWNCSGAVAGTLVDGGEGQRKLIYCGTYVGNGTLTPSNLLGFATITFTAAGQSVLLEFRGTSWVIVSNNGCTLG